MTAQRARVLRALGITPWVRRTALESARAAPSTGRAEASAVFAVLLPSQPDARVAALLERSLAALDPGLSTALRTAWRLDAPQAALPAAQIYFVFGAPVVQHVLKLAGESGLPRVELAEPAALLGAAGKRRLWEGWRALRRGMSVMPEV